MPAFENGLVPGVKFHIFSWSLYDGRCILFGNGMVMVAIDSLASSVSRTVSLTLRASETHPPVAGRSILAIRGIPAGA